MPLWPRYEGSFSGLPPFKAENPGSVQRPNEVHVSLKKRGWIEDPPLGGSNGQVYLPSMPSMFPGHSKDHDSSFLLAITVIAVSRAAFAFAFAELGSAALTV